MFKRFLLNTRGNYVVIIIIISETVELNEVERKLLKIIHYYCHSFSCLLAIYVNFTRPFATLLML